MEDCNAQSFADSPRTQPVDYYPYGEVPKDSDLDELIFYGLEWKQSER